MKRYILITTIVVIWISACENFSQYNEDPKRPISVNAESLFTSATKSLFDQMVSTNVNRNVFRLFARYWTQTTYTDESNYNLLERKIPEYHWSELYRDVLYNLQDAKAKVQSDPDGGVTAQDRQARTAQITILEVYTWQQLVDAFGNIPYSQALQPAKYTSPIYDDAANIYADLFKRLEDAISNLGAGKGFSQADVIYGGKLSAWKKFANSLKFKMAMRLADVNPSLSKAKAEEAYKAGLLQSSSDNVKVSYLSAPPNTNPLWVDLVQSGRSDYVAADTIVAIMNDLNDPRRKQYFDANITPYKGGVYGKNNEHEDFTHIGKKIMAPTLEGIIMDCVEMEFLLAEAAERGYTVTGTAQEHYNKAITLSIKYWGGSDKEATDYLAQDKVDYSKAPGTWKEKIGKQFWLGMYNRGFEGWSVYRKYDFIKFVVADNSKENVPNRYTYPVNEQNLNDANRTAAAAKLGGKGDNKATKVFWDVN